MDQCISVIAAMAEDRVIGVRNSLPWRLPEDLQHFKALTMGHHMIMGRKTFDSIGRPLPGRTTVIVTRDLHYRREGCLVVHSIEAALAACGDDPEIFFVGGGEMYAQAIYLANRMYLTQVHARFDGDAWFPAWDTTAWREVARQSGRSATGLGYDFVRYERC